MEACKLLREQDGIPVTPARPEAALSAVIAKVRATAGKLNYDGAQTAPIAVASVVDEFPTDPVGVEVADHRRRSGRARTVGVAIGDARHVFEAFAVPERGHQTQPGCFAFAAHDRSHM